MSIKIRHPSKTPFKVPFKNCFFGIRYPYPRSWALRIVFVSAPLIKWLGLRTTLPTVDRCIIIHSCINFTSHLHSLETFITHLLLLVKYYINMLDSQSTGRCEWIPFRRTTTVLKLLAIKKSVKNKRVM